MIKKTIAFIGVSVVVAGGVIGGSLYALNNAYESRVAMDKNVSRELANVESETTIPESVAKSEPTVNANKVVSPQEAIAEPAVETAPTPFNYEQYATGELASANITADYGSFQQVLRIVYGFDWSEEGENAEAEARAIVDGMINPGKETLKRAGIIDPNLEATLKFYAIRNYIVTSGQFFQVGISGAQTLKQ